MSFDAVQREKVQGQPAEPVEGGAMKLAARLPRRAKEVKLKMKVKLHPPKGQPDGNDTTTLSD